jgi:hypothetical protein
MDELDLLWEVPEACMVRVRGAVVSLTLTSVHSEWLPGIEDALRRASAAHGGPVPMLAVYRTDPRYPLRVGFDANLDDLRRTLQAQRSSLSHIAVALEFGGFLAMVMRAAIGMVGAFSRQPPLVAVHDGVVPAVRWLGEQGCEVPSAELLATVRQLKRRLECEVESDR